MELIDFKNLNLTTEESRDVIKFLAQKRYQYQEIIVDYKDKSET